MQEAMASSVKRWRIAAERQWHEGRLPWVLLWLVASGALLALIFAAWQAWGLQQRNERLRAELEAATQKTGPVTLAAAPAAAANFVHHLPPPIVHAQLLTELNRLQQELGVRVEMLALRERMPTVDQLGRSEASLSTLGGYRATTQLLKALLERYPGATLHSLQMRRLPTSTDIEGQLVLAFWSAPAGLTRPGSLP